MPKKRFSAEQIVVVLRQIEAVARQIAAGGVPGGRNITTGLRDELLNGEIFYSSKEATVVIEQWRKHFNTSRPHSSLNYRPPAPQTSAPTTHQDRRAAMQ